MSKRFIGALAMFAVVVFCAVTFAAGDDAAFVQIAVTQKMAAGARQTVELTMKNTGDTTWTTQAGHRLGAQNPGDNFTWGMNRVELPADVPPQGTVTFKFEITAPTQSGSHNFQWRMVHEGVAWFGQVTPNVAIDVR